MDSRYAGDTVCCDEHGRIVFEHAYERRTILCSSGSGSARLWTVCSVDNWMVELVRASNCCAVWYILHHSSNAGILGTDKKLQ